MGTVVVDSSVVISFFVAQDAHHHAVEQAIADVRQRAGEFSLPMSVLSESMVGGYRNGTADELHQAITSIFGRARPLDEVIALQAAELRARTRSLRLPDALVVATAIVDNADVLTCDKRLADVDERVRVVQPG